METYKMVSSRPKMEWVFEADSDESAILIAGKKDGLARVFRLVRGGEYSESDDGYRRGGKLEDKWVFVATR